MINPYTFGMTATSAPRTSSAPSGTADASDLRYLEDRVDRLSLICMAMWSLMSEKSNISEEDLMQRVKVLDLMDGKEDGKATKTVSKCSQCDRPMNVRHKKCIYCGHAKLIQSAFDAL